MFKLLGLALLIVSTISMVEDEWYPMPDGKLYHIDCIHHFDDHFHLENLGETDIITHSRGMETHGPCPYEPRKIETAPLQYYSNWVAYVQHAHEAGYGSMYSEFVVPSKPKSRGPAGLSSVYIFNGLEDGGGHKGGASLILQPVLQTGKSGCLLNPINYPYYWLTSYQVTGAGRAYCGKNLGPLAEGERLSGNMTLVDKKAGTWLIQSIRFKNGDISSTSAKLPNITLDAAYITLEGMVIYGCDAFPQSNSVTFENNQLFDLEGNVVKPTWEKIINHGECNQDVEITDKSIRIKWDHTVSKSQEIE